MRLIDANELIHSGAWSTIITQTQYDKMVKVIDQLPTIDAVEVVRCKDCKHCADDYIDTGMGTMPQFTCELGMCAESVQPTDYCSYGERSE